MSEGRAALRVLLADDDPVQRLLLGKYLEALGVRAEVAGDGASAAALGAAGAFDVIFMDVEMPGMDGIEATRRLRSAPAGPRPPRIVALTGSDGPEARARCRDAGMDDFLAKPVKKADLEGALDRAERAFAAVVAVSAPAEARAHAQAPLLDGAALRGFIASIGDEGLAELLDTLLTNMATLVAEVESAHAAGDRDGLRRHAHSLKSNARMFALGRLGERCRAIEDIARGELAGDVAALVGGLRLLFEESRAALIGELRG